MTVRIYNLIQGKGQKIKDMFERKLYLDRFGVYQAEGILFLMLSLFFPGLTIIDNS